MTVKQTEAFLRHQLEKDQERHASNDPTEQPILRFKLEDIGRQSDDDDKSDDDIDGDAETYNCDHDLDRTNDDLARGSLEGVEDAEIFVIQDSSFDLKAADYLSSRSLRSGRTIRTWRSVKTRATRSHSFSHATTPAVSASWDPSTCCPSPLSPSGVEEALAGGAQIAGAAAAVILSSSSSSSTTTTTAATAATTIAMAASDLTRSRTISASLPTPSSSWSACSSLFSPAFSSSSSSSAYSSSSSRGGVRLQKQRLVVVESSSSSSSSSSLASSSTSSPAPLSSLPPELLYCTSEWLGGADLGRLLLAGGGLVRSGHVTNVAHRLCDAMESGLRKHQRGAPSSGNVNSSSSSSSGSGGGGGGGGTESISSDHSGSSIVPIVGSNAAADNEEPPLLLLEPVAVPLTGGPRNWFARLELLQCIRDAREVEVVASNDDINVDDSNTAAAATVSETATGGAAQPATRRRGNAKLLETLEHLKAGGGLPGGRLRLIGAALGDAGAAILARALVASSLGGGHAQGLGGPLHLVNLSGNGIGDAGAARLATALKMHAASLHAICLARNTLGSAGCAAIAGVAATCARLGVLYLAANPLTRAAAPPKPGGVQQPGEEEEAAAVEEELVMNPYDPRLWALQPTTADGDKGSDGDGDSHDDDGAAAAADDAAAAVDLAGADALVAAVAGNPTIVTLSVRETGLAADVAQRLRDAWAHRSPVDLLL